MLLMEIYKYYFLTVNVMAYLAFYVDKQKARKGEYRIPENVLMLLTIIGGGAGALVGMLLHRHKTKKSKFTIGVPASFLVIITQFMLVFYITLLFI